MLINCHCKTNYIIVLFLFSMIDLCNLQGTGNGSYKLMCFYIYKYITLYKWYMFHLITQIISNILFYCELLHVYSYYKVVSLLWAKCKRSFKHSVVADVLKRFKVFVAFIA